MRTRRRIQRELDQLWVDYAQLYDDYTGMQEQRDEAIDTATRLSTLVMSYSVTLTHVARALHHAMRGDEDAARACIGEITDG